MFFFEKMSKFYQEYIKQPADNLGDNIAKWFTHGRFGGLVNMRNCDFTELVNIKTYYETIILDSKNITHQNNKTFHLFDIDWTKEKPEANPHEILKCFNYDSRNNKGEFSFILESTSKIIKACVNLRLSSWASLGFSHLNGSAILFCAEMATWINAAASLEVSEEFLLQVMQRIEYLSAIEENEIFKNEAKTDYAVDWLIYNIRMILEKDMIPKMKASLTERSSREYFKMLGRESKKFLNKTAQGLFYLFTEEEKIQDVYDLNTFKYISLNTTNQAKQTELGKVFGILALAYEECERVLLNQPKMPQNTFIDQKSNSSQANLLQLSLYSQQGQNTGIHKFMQNPMLLETLVTCFGLLQDYCLFIRAFRQAYTITGECGDMMFLALYRETGLTLDIYKRLEIKLSDLITKIRSSAEDKYTELVKEKQNSGWKSNYLLSKRCFNEAENALMESNKYIQLIMNRMDLVRTPAYMKEVQEQIEQFRNIVGLIEERIGIPTLTIALNERQNSLSNNRYIIHSSRNTDRKSTIQLLKDHEQILKAEQVKKN